MALPLVVRILGTPTKLFYDAFRHTQRAVADEPRRLGEVVDPEDEVNPFVGFRISLFMGAMAVFAVFQTLDRRAPIFVILAFTGLSCAWQLRPFWRQQPRMDGKVPRPGIANWILSHHAATSLVLDVVGNGAMAVSLAAAGFFGAWNGRAAWGVVLMLMWLPFNRFVFANLAVLELLKYHTASRLRFAVFRRFQSPDRTVDKGFDERHRHTVLPVLGAFGKVSVPFNESLDRTRPSANVDTAEINAGTKSALKFDPDTWAHEALQLIQRSDVAVFHWGSVLSESMLLEYRIAERMLTPQRMILVVDEDAGALFELSKRGLNLSMPVISVKGGYSAFLSELRRVLRAMADAPVTLATDGAWSAEAWDVLQYAATHHSEPGLPSGPWLLPATLGGGKCELVMVAGHLMGRGRDDAGWFQVQGSYRRMNDDFSIEGTQHYLAGTSRIFHGHAHGDSRITVHVPGQPDAEMIYVLP